MGKTPRERLAKTLVHQDPGKVVCDLGATPITGIHADAMARLRDKLGLPQKKIRISDPLQLLGIVEDDLMERLGIDVAGVTNNYTLFGFENTGWKPWTLPSGLEVEIPQDFNTSTDEQGNTYLYPQGDTSVQPSGKMPKGGFFFDNVVRVYQEFDEDNPNPKEDFGQDFPVYTEAQLRTIEERCNWLYNNTDLGLIGGGALDGIGDFATLSGPAVKRPGGIRNIEDWLIAHYTEPDYIKEVYAMQTEAALQNAKLFYQACGNKIQVMQISGTDFGTQRGPYISVDLYREFYKPYHKQVNDWVHQNTEWKTFFHCCGSAVEFLEDFHDAGVDVLNPVQISAYGMDPHWLKQEWGQKLVFWGGGSDTQQTLAFGTPQEVYEETSRLLGIFAPGGGYVFNAIHNIQANTPTENILSMFKALEDYNKNC